MNYGLLDGVNEGAGWKTYRPKILGVLGSSGNPDADAPVLDPSSTDYQKGRFIISEGVVHGYVQVSFVGTFNPGTASYLFELPVPARRMHDSLPQILGEAMVYRSFSNPAVNVQCVAQLADNAFRTLWDQTGTGGVSTSVGDPDGWFQIQAPYALRWGSDSCISTTTTNITHNLLPLDTSKQNLGELTITPTSAINGSGNFEPAYASGMGGNQVGIKGQASAGSSPGMTFDWVWEAHSLTRRVFASAGAETGTSVNVPTSVPMVGYRHPLDLSQLTAISPFGNIFVSFSYEPA